MKPLVGILLMLVTAGAWVLYWTLGWQVADALAAALGQEFLRMGDGKFSDPALFLHSRMREAAGLLTATALLGAVAWAAAAIGKKLRGPWRWIAPSVIGFVGVNLWLSFAMGTCLFWLCFWNGKGNTNNLTQFNIKLLLMPDQREPLKVVLAGSSQMLAQVNASALNHRLAPKAFATGLQFPGNRAFDFCLLPDILEGTKADLIVCYVSEMTFFATGTGPGFSAFFGFDDLPVFSKLGGRIQWYPREMGYALLGDLMPVFRLRSPLSERVLGAEVINLKQQRRDATLTFDMAKRAEDASAGYCDDDQATFQFAAFREFVACCQREGRRVVICCGQLNPLLAERLDPRLRPKMISTLGAVAAEFENVVLVPADALPEQTTADYDDLTHVNKAAQERFTEALAVILQRDDRRLTGEEGRN